MEISFQNIVFSGFVLQIIIILGLYGKKRGLYGKKNVRGASLLAVFTTYYVLTAFFFWKALVYDCCLLPGDILGGFFPWKTTGLFDSPPENSLLWDAVSACYPWMCSLKTALEEGVLPLWNFHSYSGSPLAAGFAAAQFNPFNIFLFFMNVEDFSTLMPFLRLIVSATGTFAFLRVIGFSRMPAFTGGLLFSFSGVNIVWLSNYPNITVIMFLPWLLLCVERMAAGKGPGWCLAFVFCSVFQFLGGHPESSFHMYLFVGAYFLYQLYCQRKSGAGTADLFKRLVTLAGAGLLAMGCVSFQLLPFLEYLPLSTRYFEIIESNNNIFGSFEFLELLNLIAGTVINPDFFGNPVDGNYWGFANYNEQNSYFTVAGLFLCGLGLLARASTRAYGRFGEEGSALAEKNGPAPADNEPACCIPRFGKWFFLGAALFSFGMIVRVPVFYAIVKDLPGFDMAANYRLIFVMVFSFVVFAVAGLESLTVQRSVTLFHVLLTVSVLVLLALILHFSTLTDIKEGCLNYRIKKLVFFFLVLGIMAVVSAAALYYKKLASLLPVLVLVVVWIDVWHHGADYNTFIGKDKVFSETPMISFITGQAGKYRVVGCKGVLLQGAEQVYGYDSIIGYDAMKINAYENILARINGSYNPVFTPEIESLTSDWLNFLNVRYVAAPPFSNDKFFLSDRFELVYDGEDGRVFENKKCMPRVFWADHMIAVETREDAAQIMDGKGFSPEKQVVVEVTPALQKKIAPGLMGSPQSVSQMKGNYGRICQDNAVNRALGKPLSIKKYSGNEIVVINTRTAADDNLAPGRDNYTGQDHGKCKGRDPKGGKLIVLSEVWFPGWQVTVDGKPKDLLRVNNAFMGVVVFPGEKEIGFAFKPESLQTGCLISFISFVIGIIAMAGPFFVFHNRSKA
ncbi:MAG: YfhO family protein [Thermodesulfobacteriota bacterium]|nr:YfhO family protein [Thermodesulfobacteriota bacterium]